MKRFCYLILFLGCLLTSSKLFAQNIQIDSDFNTGTYGNGSNITVPVSLSGVFNQNEKFEIWLSDANGDFSASVKIGEYQGFFTTFVNGLLPTGLANGTGYKIEVRATTTLGVAAVTTPAFSISGSQAVVAKISPGNTVTVFKADEIFGRCLPSTNGLIFSSQSTPNSAITTVITKNEITNQPIIGNIINELAKSYFTVTVTTTQDGIIGTRSYAIINTDNSNPLQSTYTSPVCVNPDDPNSGGITFRVNIDSGADVYKNYPGTKYVIDWSDGTVQTLTLAEIIELGGIITHRYTISSCNQSVQSNGVIYYNSFGIQSKAIHPFCAEGAPTINIARAFEMPRVAIESPTFACKNSSVTFVNKSTQGTYGDQNQPTCTGNNIFFDWYVDGNLVLPNVNITTNLTYTFTTSGIHTITLVPVDPSSTLPCIPNMVTTTICIEEIPAPVFQFNQSGSLVNTLKGCVPLTVTTKNQSNTVDICSAASYEWTLINNTTNVSGFYNNNAIFTPGDSETSLEPEFSISNPGNYTLTLRIKNTCSEEGITTSRNFIVVGPPSVSPFNYTAAYCEPVPKTINFDQHTYNANSAPSADVSYTWTITGGDYEYLNGTTAASPYPTVQFKSYGTYTIKVDYDNACSVSTQTQTITFNQPLIASITANTSATDISVCTGSVINLQGTISGPAGYTYQWIASSNAGGTITAVSTDPASPSATYTPVPADDDQELTFTLRVIYPTPVPATCTSPLEQSIKVTYTATNTAANSAINRCTGIVVDFTPTSTLSGSQFIWTILSQGPNISGANANLVYAAGPINDVLVNSGAAPETVVYQITPRSATGCDGTPFTLTVTVLPNITGNSIGNAQSICINQAPALLGQADGLVLGGGDGLNYVYLWEQRVGNTAWLTATGTANQATYQPGNLTVTTEYRRKVYSPNAEACFNESDPITITVNPLPAITLGAVSDICNTATSFSIPYTNPQNNPNRFSIVPGTRVMPGFVSVSDVSFSTSPLIITIPANVAQGTYDFKLVFKNDNGCESVEQSISLTVKTPPTLSNAGSNQVKCQNGSFTLNGNIPTSGTGTWSILDPLNANGAVIANPALANSTLSGLQEGKSVVLRWTISNGPCIDSFSDVVLTNEPATTVSNAGAAQRNCNNDSFTLNANSPALNETGVWSIVSGTVILPADLSTPTLNISGVPAGQSATLRWTIENAACQSTSTITVTNLSPITNNVISFTGPDPCSSQSINILGSLPAGGSGGAFPSNFNYTWQYKNTIGGWDNLGISTQNLSNFTVTSNITLRRLVSSYECSVASNELTINVLPPLSNTIAGAQTICFNTSPTELTGNIASGGDDNYTYQWQSSASSSSGFTDISGAVAINYQPGVLSSTTYFRRVVSSGTCIDISTVVQVKVNPKPAMTNIADKTYCAGSVITSAAFTSTPGINTTYRWTNSNTSIGLGASGNGTLPVFTTLNNLKVPVEATITVIPTYNENGINCDGDPASFKIIVLPNIAVSPIADQTLCTDITTVAYAPATDALNLPVGASITYRWTINGSGTNLLNGSGVQIPSFITTNIGTTELESTLTIFPIYNLNGISCEGISATYKITVKPNPSVANAGTDVKICETSYQLNANNPVVGTGTWTQVSGPSANITNASLYNTTVTALQTGYRYEFRWTITNSPCSTPSVANVIVDVLSPIINSIKIDNTTVCAGETVILSSNALSGGDIPSVFAASYGFQWESSVNGTSNWQPIPGTLETLTVNPTADIYIRRLVKSYAICEVISPAILLRVNPATPEASAGSDQILCNLIQTQLQANNPGSFIGTWTDVTPGGSTLTFTNANQFDTAVNGLVAGQTYTLKWTITGLAPCPDDDDELTITVRPEITTADAGADAKLCDQGLGNNSFTLSANTPQSFETGTWTIINQPGSSNASFDNPNNPTAKILNLIPGQYTLLWTINNDADDCTPSSKSMILEVFAAPVAGNLRTATTEVCDTGNSGILTLTSFVGDIQQWEWSTDNTNWNIIVNTTDTYSFTNLTQTTYYRVKVVSKGLAVGCTTFVYAATQSVVVYPASVGGSTAIALGTDTVCEGINSGNLSLNDYVGTVIRWESSIDGGLNWAPITNTAGLTSYTYSNLLVTTQFRAVVQSGVCADAKSTVTTINVLPPVTQAQTTDAEECNVTTTNLNGNVPLSGQGTWIQVEGPTVSIADIHNPKSVITSLVPGVYRFTWTIDNGVCAPSSATQTISNYPPLINEIQTSIATICSGQVAVLSDKSHSGGKGTYSFEWQTSTDNINWNPAISGEINANLSAILTGSLYFRRTVISGPCLSISNSVLITVQPPIGNNVITGPAEVCILKPVPSINGSNPDGADGIYTFQWQLRTATTSWADIPNEVSIGLQPSPITENTWYRRIVRSALCTGPQQSISNELALEVRFNAIASFTASKTIDCLPFNLSSVINVTPYPDLNATYEWFANEVSIGTGPDFPGYTITTDGTKVAIKLITTSLYGCDTDEKIIEFETIKSVEAGFTKSTAQGCGPLSVIFTNSSAPLVGASYNWDFGNGQTSNLLNPGSITFLAHPLNRDTTYVIRLRAYTNCQESFFTDSVLVRPTPISIFSPDKTEGCSPLLVNFSNQSKGEPATYEFDFGDGSPIYTTNSLEDVAHTFTVLSTTIFTVNLKVTNECGTSSSSYTVRVRPNTVTANLVVNGDDKLGCPPHTVTFYNNSVGANQFTWDFGDGSPLEINASTTMTHTFVTGGIYQVKLTATNGCSVQETSEIVTVYPEPISSFTTSRTNYCVAEEIQFQNTSPIGAFLWQFGDGTSSTQINPTHQYAIPGTYSVMLTTSVTQADGTQCSKTVTTQIEIIPLPVPQFSTNASALNCAPFLLAVQNTSQYAEKYAWYIDGVLISTDKTPTNLWLTAADKIITIKLVAENALGCSFSTEQKIQMYPRPTANFSVLPGEVIKIPEYTFNFQNTTTGNVNGYQWSFGDGSTSTATNPSHTYAELGIYQVKLVARNSEGCTDTLIRQVEIQTVPGYLYVPNAFEPASLVAELKNFKPKGSGIAQYQIRVFNKMGSLLWESSQLDYNNSPAEGWDGTINGQPAPPDVYVWSIDATFINRTIWKGMKYQNADQPKTTGTIHLIR